MHGKHAWCVLRVFRASTCASAGLSNVQDDGKNATLVAQIRARVRIRWYVTLTVPVRSTRVSSTRRSGIASTLLCFTHPHPARTWMTGSRLTHLSDAVERQPVVSTVWWHGLPANSGVPDRYLHQPGPAQPLDSLLYLLLVAPCTGISRKTCRRSSTFKGCKYASP